MVKYLSTVPSDGVKIAKLSEVVGISKESVSKLLEALEHSMIIKGIEYSGRNRMYKKPKKWFFYSPSMRSALASPVSSPSDITGNQREDAVFLHLSSFSNEIFYSYEADFIVNGMKFEVGKNKKPREGVIILGMDEKIDKNSVPIPLFSLMV